MNTATATRGARGTARTCNVAVQIDVARHSQIEAVVAYVSGGIVLAMDRLELSLHDSKNKKSNHRADYHGDEQVRHKIKGKHLVADIGIGLEGFIKFTLAQMRHDRLLQIVKFSATEAVDRLPRG